MLNANGLVTSVDMLGELLRPILRGDVELAAIDTETSEVLDDRFTPYGTNTRIAGFSISYDCAPGRGCGLREHDFYVPLRHLPYDWRRPPEKLQEKSPELYQALIEVEHVSPGGGWAAGKNPNLPLDPCIHVLQDALRAGATRWIAHNWGFDGPMLEAEGLGIPWERIEETQFLSQLTDIRPLDAWDVAKKKWVVSHGLKELGEYVLGIPAEREARLIEARKALGKGSAQLMDYSMLPLRTIVSPYACMDTRLALNLFRACVERPGFQDVRIQERYGKELRLIPRLKDMQRVGVEVRVDRARELAVSAEAAKEDAAARANAAAGMGLHLGHSETLCQQLYGNLQIPMYRGKSDTTKPTLKMILKGLGEGKQRNVVQAILDYRAAEKELTAFYRPLAEFSVDGTIHTLIRQMAAATIRMSSAKPNLQQMKKKGEVRRVFKPRDGHVFVFFDYDQIEMRIAAHYTKMVPASFNSYFTWGCTMAKRGSCKGRPPHGPEDDLERCKEFVHHSRRGDWQHRPERLYLYEGFMGAAGFDPHQRMALVAGVPRDNAKASNFALLYGAGYVKLSEVLDCTAARAKELFHFFWSEAYPELGYVRAFIDERLRRTGMATRHSHRDFITTLKGGRIYLRSAYKGLNYLIQRSAREVFGDGLLDVCAYCDSLPGYVPLMPVHDEIVMEVAREDYDVSVLRNIAGLMAGQSGDCCVPLTVGCERSETSWHKDEREEVKL